MELCKSFSNEPMIIGKFANYINWKTAEFKKFLESPKWTRQSHGNLKQAIFLNYLKFWKAFFNWIKVVTINYRNRNIRKFLNLQKSTVWQNVKIWKFATFGKLEINLKLMTYDFFLFKSNFHWTIKSIALCLSGI